MSTRNLLLSLQGLRDYLSREGQDEFSLIVGKAIAYIEAIAIGRTTDAEDKRD